MRIALEPKELAEHPLRVGLSMEARVDVSREDGALLADPAQTAAATQTKVFDSDGAAAEAAVRRIVAANLGRGTAVR